MYKITSGDNVYYSDTLTFIKLAKNGCYIPCDEKEAQGFCVKIPVSYTDDDGVMVNSFADTVFATGTLTGKESTGEHEQFLAAQVVTDATDMKAALSALGYKET
jgi:hypothetical protein